MKNKYFMLIIFVFLLIGIGLVLMDNGHNKISSAVTYEEITKEQALTALLSAQDSMQELRDNGFNTTKVNDTLSDAWTYFEGQNYTILLNKIENINNSQEREKAALLLLSAKDTIVSGGTVDYSKVIEKTRDVENIKKSAYEANDILIAFELRVKELRQIDGINLTDAENSLKLAKEAFYSERYGNVKNLVDEGYTNSDRAAEEATKLKLLYKAGRENFIGYLQAYWKEIILIILILTVVGFFSYPRIYYYITYKKLKNLELEREVLTDLIKRSQIERFQKGEITQREYELKTDRLRERTAEVEELIPVLKDNLERIKQKKFFEFWRKKK